MQDRQLKKSLGQHFLHDPNVARKIVSRLKLKPDDNIVEIGPGNGALTKVLHDSDTRLIVLEKDERWAKAIKSSWPKMDVVSVDAMNVDWTRFNIFDFHRLKIIGNLPYNVASPLLWRLVSQIRSVNMVFTIQKDVAQRITAKPGNRTYGALSAWIQNFARVKYEFNISENVFHPRPNVKSAVISLGSCQYPDCPKDPEDLAGILHMCFQKRRKQLKKIFKDYWDWELEQKFDELGINPECRPESLSPRDFRDVCDVFGQFNRQKSVHNQA